MFWCGCICSNLLTLCFIIVVKCTIDQPHRLHTLSQKLITRWNSCPERCRYVCKYSCVQIVQDVRVRLRYSCGLSWWYNQYTPPNSSMRRVHLDLVYVSIDTLYYLRTIIYSVIDVCTLLQSGQPHSMQFDQLRIVSTVHINFVDNAIILTLF